jgi:hypothetical protein
MKQDTEDFLLGIGVGLTITGLFYLFLSLITGSYF